MNLLLLLSAMLSALSGAGLGARAPQVPVAVNAVNAVAATAQALPAVATGRPIQAPPSRPESSVGDGRAAWRIAPVEPLYLSRRRE